MELTGRLSFLKERLQGQQCSSSRKLDNKSTKLKATVSLSKISKNEIVKMRRRAPIIYGMNRRGRRSDASSDAQPIGNHHVFKALNARQLEATH